MGVWSLGAMVPKRLLGIRVCEDFVARDKIHVIVS